MAPLDPVVLLFGSTRRRVLGWLLGHSGEAFYLRDLARRSGTPVGAAQRELEQLASAGLVVRDERGKQVYFQANREALIFPELYGLFVKTVFVTRVPPPDGESRKEGAGEPPVTGKSARRLGSRGQRKQERRR